MLIYMRNSILVICFAVSISCSDQSTEIAPCPITVDSVSIIDSMKVEEVTYYLVYRISGWSDKTEIFELFDKKPAFDHCSRSDIEPIYGDSLEMDQTIVHVKLDMNNKVLDIVYKNGIPDKTHNSNLKLELK